MTSTQRAALLAEMVAASTPKSETNRGGAHAPVSLGAYGIGCACGFAPAKAAQTRTHAPYASHVKKLGLGVVRNVSHAVFPVGHAAAGMTWNEAYEAGLVG